MIAHHPPDDLLMQYAAGAATGPRALLVASHLTLCPQCRAVVSRAEALGAALMEDAPPQEVDRGMLDRVMARLDAPADLPAPMFDDDAVLPGPIAQLVGRFRDLPWRRRFFGVEEVVVDQEASGMPARLFRLADGGFIPPHEHVGTETSLVLTGGFTDDAGHFGRGDVSHREDGTRHEQSIDEGEPCVVLVVADAPFRPRSFVAWVASLVAGF